MRQQAIKSAGCACSGVCGRQDQHLGRTCHQPVCARQNMDSALKKIQIPGAPPNLHWNLWVGAGDFDVQTELRTTA